MVFLPILLSIDIRCSTGWASPFFWMIFVSFISFKFSLFSFGCALRFAITCSQLVLKTLAYFLGTGSSDDSIAHTKITEKKNTPTAAQYSFSISLRLLRACVYLGLWCKIAFVWFMMVSASPLISCLHFFVVATVVLLCLLQEKKKKYVYFIYISRDTQHTAHMHSKRKRITAIWNESVISQSHIKCIECCLALCALLVTAYYGLISMSTQYNSGTIWRSNQRLAIKWNVPRFYRLKFGHFSFISSIFVYCGLMHRHKRTRIVHTRYGK